MGYPRLKNLTEEQKLERKKQQKREAQKRYYDKNREKYKEYYKTYQDKYTNIKDENVLLRYTLKHIRDYITNIPNYKHLSYFETIIEEIDGVINDNR